MSGIHFTSIHQIRQAIVVLEPLTALSQSPTYLLMIESDLSLESTNSPTLAFHKAQFTTDYKYLNYDLFKSK